MALALQPDEKQIIKALLQFANLPRIGAADGYTRALRCLQHTSPGFDAEPVWVDPRGGPEVDFRVARADAQAVVRGWLDRVTKSERERRAVASEINPALATVTSVLVFDGRRLRHYYKPFNVQALCMLALALILDESRGLASRLKRCGWSKCGRFNLTLDPKGRPRKFCNEDHARRFSNEDSRNRQKRYRLRRQSTKERL